MSKVETILPYTHQLQQLTCIGKDCYQRGWSRGTSSNYSLVVARDPLQLLITASGKDKGALTEADFVLVDASGEIVQPSSDAKQTAQSTNKASAETLLHCWAASNRKAGAVLHTHSVWATVLSERFCSQGGIWFENFEMLKGIEGVQTHQTRRWLPLIKNSQDMPALRKEIEQRWQQADESWMPGFLLAQHGMYCWGDDFAMAARHLEVLEFLLECTGRSMMLR